MNHEVLVRKYKLKITQLANAEGCSKRQLSDRIGRKHDYLSNTGKNRYLDRQMEAVNEKWSGWFPQAWIDSEVERKSAVMAEAFAKRGGKPKKRGHSFDPYPYPLTVAEMKANPPAYNWRTA